MMMNNNDDIIYNSEIENSFLNMESFGLYLHIPYCQGKCRYCDFYSQNYTDISMEAYLDSLKKELKIYSGIINSLQNYKKKAVVDTIYFGGGTPSLLKVDQLAEIIEIIIKNFSYPSSDEITIEANPFSLTEEKIKGYREAGVNRLSLGVQSFNDRELKFLGRRHNEKEALKKIDLIGKYFDNYNIDLIFAIPGQRLEDWKSTLEKVININPNHISLYNLQIEEETPLAKSLKLGEFKEVDDSLDAEMYLLARKMLSNKGYQHYEISNFAKKGYQSRHNRLYWELKPYLGLGPSAHSFINKKRFNNHSDIELYRKKLDSNHLAISNIIKLNKEDLIAEKMFMGLRLLEGFSLTEFTDKFGIELLDYYGREIKKLKKLGLIYFENGRIKLTEKGILHGNRVFMEFLP